MSDFNTKDYWEKRLTRTNGLAGVGYAGLGGSFNGWMYRVRKHVFRNALAQYKNQLKNEKILDVGCGTGFYVQRWRELEVTDITGVDLTDVAVKRLHEAFPDYTFKQADITAPNAPFEIESFGAISAFDILFHVVDDELFLQALKNIYSMLKPDGLFIWSDNFLKERKELAKHQICRSLDEITNQCHHIGFEIVDRRPMFYLMNAPVDSDSRILRKNWHIIQKYITKTEWLGWLYGASLFPLELLLLSLASEGPSTEMMICRKKTGAA